MNPKFKATLATIGIIVAVIALLVFPKVTEWIGIALICGFILLIVVMGLRDIWRGLYQIFGGDITPDE